MDSSDLLGSVDAVDSYLKKHKLDLKVLPDKKFIKLSDLTSMSSSPSLDNTNEFPSRQIVLNYSSSAEDEIYDFEDDSNELQSTSGGGGGEHQTTSDVENKVQVYLKQQVGKERKSKRKKREPSLKIQQRLSMSDLELIVNCVKNKQARVHIADVKKDTYVDKILRVELIKSETDVTNDISLSNGQMEALLKKSMFPKEIHTLFDTFVNALCGQSVYKDEQGNEKPALKCLVVDCEFASFSEAEILRHIKRHLAQDGYTCEHCSHQFASMTNLQRHVKIHSGSTNKQVKCGLCEYRASTLTHVKRHMAHKHLERSLPCPHCSFMGATNAELKIHMARKHLELTGKNPLFLPKYLRKDYQCSICKEQYNDFKEFQIHTYQHTSTQNRFRCTECPYNCKNLSKLKRHMLYHMGARNFECKQCGNKFFQMEHLKRHLQSIHNTYLDTSSSTVAKTPSDAKNDKTEELKDENPIGEAEEVSKSQREEVEETVEMTSESVQDTEYKCLNCSSFTTRDLFSLNQHSIREHRDLNAQFFTTNQTDLIQSDDQEDSLIDETKFYLCSFCFNFKSNSKQEFKNHLNKSHLQSSQQLTIPSLQPPLLLNNDPLLTDPTTQFRCESCQFYLNSLSEFAKHMQDVHKTEVQIVMDGDDKSMDNETKMQDGSHQSMYGDQMMLAESAHQSSLVVSPLSVSTKSLIRQQQAVVVNPLIVNRSSSQKQRQLSSAFKSRHTSMPPSQSVRINPFFLKQHHALKQQQQKQDQVKTSTNSSSQSIYQISTESASGLNFHIDEIIII